MSPWHDAPLATDLAASGWRPAPSAQRADTLRNQAGGPHGSAVQALSHPGHAPATPVGQPDDSVRWGQTGQILLSAWSGHAGALQPVAAATCQTMLRPKDQTRQASADTRGSTVAGQPGQTRSTARAAISETAAITATTLPANVTGSRDPERGHRPGGGQIAVPQTTQQQRPPARDPQDRHRDAQAQQQQGVGLHVEARPERTHLAAGPRDPPVHAVEDQADASRGRSAAGGPRSARPRSAASAVSAATQQHPTSRARVTPLAAPNRDRCQ